MKPILALYDTEAPYTVLLTGELSHRPSNPFEVHGFTSRRELETYLRSQEAQILLISEKDYTEDLPLSRAETVLLLREGSRIPVHSHYPAIDKYQSASELLSALLLQCAPLMEGVALSRPRVLSFASPLGRSGKTTLSLTASLLLSMQKSVLYLTLDPFTELSLLLPKTGEGTLSDVLYHLTEDTESIAAVLSENVSVFRSLRYLPPVTAPQDIPETPPSAWRSLLSAAAKAGPYDCILIDAVSSLPDPLPLLSASDHIFLTGLPDTVSTYKLKLYQEYLLTLDRSLQTRIREITLPRSLSKEERLRTPDSLLYSETGSFVSSLLKEEGL